MAKTNTTEHETLEDIESHVPDSMHPILEAAFKYQKQIVIGVVTIIAATALYAGINAYNKHAMADAQAKLGAILIEARGQEKMDKLEGLLNAAPSSIKPAILLELAQSSMTTGQYDKAVGYWNQLAGNTDEDLNIVARMGKAKCLMLAGKPAEAVTILQDLEGVVAEDFTVPVVRELAVAAEAAGDKGLALTSYKKLAAKPIADKPFVDYKVAQLEAK